MKWVGMASNRLADKVIEALTPPVDSWRWRDIEYQNRKPEWEIMLIMERKLEQYFERKERDNDARTK